MVGFLLLAFSIILGAVWANYALGGQWSYFQAQGGGPSGVGLRSEKRTMRLGITGMVLCLMTALVGIGGAAPPDILPVAGRHSVKLGEPAPNFQLRDLQGRLVALSDMRGKVVMVNFWATWCGPCRVEMPAMEQLYQTFSRKDFEILAVSTDAEGVSVTKPFQKENRLTFPILHDADYRVGLIYGARSLPMTFMVDRQGIVRHQIFGARDWGAAEAHQLVQMLMKF
jgi:peroxiredoxin